MSGLLGLPYGTTFATDMPGVQPAAAPSPFVWGAGGAKLTPAQVLAQQQQGARLSQPNYAPVGSIWEGVGRLTDNIRGALETRSANKAASALQAQHMSVAQALLKNGSPDAVGAAITSGDEALAGLGGDVYKNQHPKASAPHYWETNNGSLGMIGADGKPTIAYQDPTPKITTIAVDNGDQTKTLYQVGPDGVPIGSGVQGGAGKTAAPSAPPVGTVEDGHRFIGGDPGAETSWVPVVATGGAAPSGTATFR